MFDAFDKTESDDIVISDGLGVRRQTMDDEQRVLTDKLKEVDFFLGIVVPIAPARVLKASDFE